MKELITCNEDLLFILDQLLQEEKNFNWDSFYTERDRKVPFFKNVPDENLVSYFSNNYLEAGKVLELGCGPGRNAVFLADKGCEVDAVDSSQEALKWADERAEEYNVNVNFIKEDIFQLQFEENTYDLVYDSGCFHHIAPHRRVSYINLLKNALKPGGHFALTCFVEGGELGGSAITDLEVYKLRSMQGGLGYSEEKLKSVFNDFDPIDIRVMEEKKLVDGVFGVTGLRTALFQYKY